MNITETAGQERSGWGWCALGCGAEEHEELKDEEAELEVLVGWKWKSTNQSNPKLSLFKLTKRY